MYKHKNALNSIVTGIKQKANIVPLKKKKKGKVKETFSYSERRRGAHLLYRSEPARHDECQCTGNWTMVSQRVRYLPQTQGPLLINNPSVEWTEATVHEWLAQEYDANFNSRESKPGLSSESLTLNRLRYQRCAETNK